MEKENIIKSKSYAFALRIVNILLVLKKNLFFQSKY